MEVAKKVCQKLAKQSSSLRIWLVLFVGFAAEIIAFPCIVGLHKLHNNLGGLRAAPASIDVRRMSTLRGAYIALRMADNYGPYGEPNGNATATWDKDLGMELLRAKRPKGVDDWVEGIPQAPTTDTLKRNSKNEDEPVYAAYESGMSEEGWVGSKIGLEKQTGDYSSGLFAGSSRAPQSGRDRIRETESNFVGAFSQEKNFIGGLIGCALLALFYVSVYNNNGGTMDAPRYAAAPPGTGKVIERYEEAFVCYGVPTAEDPNGCRDKRSVGPVRVFSRAPPPPTEQPSPNTQPEQEE